MALFKMVRFSSLSREVAKQNKIECICTLSTKVKVTQNINSRNGEKCYLSKHEVFFLNFGTSILNKDLDYDLNGSCVRPIYKKVQFVNQLEDNV